MIDVGELDSSANACKVVLRDRTSSRSSWNSAGADFKAL